MAKCFVITPYGKKLDIEGKEVDFDQFFEAVVDKAIREAGLETKRSDHDLTTGPVFIQMIKDIADAEVCIADITTLNPNVFYELGVRHALRRGPTILIRRKDHPLPFNIQSLRVFDYGPPDSPEFDGAVNKIVDAIKTNRERDHKEPDSLVFRALPELNVSISKPTPIESVRRVRYPLTKNPQRSIGLIGGNLAEVRGVSVWVNSENTDLQMARYFERTISSTIRYYGARKKPDGHVEEDIIADDLAAWKVAHNTMRVMAGTVIRTRPGELADFGVKFVLHVASVEGTLDEGYKATSKIRECVLNTLQFLNRPEQKADFGQDEKASIVFPLLGTGVGGMKVWEAAPGLFKAALEHLERTPATIAETVWFLTNNEENWSACEHALHARDILGRLQAAVPED